MRGSAVNGKDVGDNVCAALRHQSSLFVMVLMERARRSPISSAIEWHTVSGVSLR